MNELEKNSYAENVRFRHRTYQISKALWKMVEKDWSTWVESAGLTINEHHILLSAYLHGKMKLTDLSIYGMMHVSTAVNYSRKLELAGLIHFEKDTHDKRVNYIEITDAGKKIVEELEDKWQAEDSLVVQSAMPIEQLFGSRPRFMEATGVVRSYYGEEFMSHIEAPCEALIREDKE